MHLTTLFALIALLSTTGWAGYVLEDDYFADAFFDQFTFWDAEDPTHGFVEYKAYDDALDAKLISNTSTNIRMGADHTNKCPTGRPSVRISSNKSYNFGLFVVDIDHMPGGICGTWPAFWLLGPDWPNNGEIDIIEGANEQPSNFMTLHTGPGCAISDEGGFSGVLTSEHCVSGSGGDNTGCQIAAQNSSTNTYGNGFNANNGGIYATEWTSDYIKIWFFPRGACPEDALGDSPDPAGWGEPVAHFEGACDFGTTFERQQIVFDTTFCGDWAGNDWNKTCAAKAPTCEAFVENNPEAFKEAYWSVNALKVYQSNGASSPSISTHIATSTSIQYVTQPESSYVAQTMMPTAYPTTLAISTKPNGYIPLPESASSIAGTSPSETGSSYVPVVGSDGSVGYESGTAASPPAYTSGGGGGGGGWFSNANGAMGYSGGHGHGSRDLASETRDRHARHLRAHKRHGKGRL